MDVCVIGAGAAGLMAAIWAARGGASVTLLEGMERPGKKLAVTGNGRCNLTNKTAVDGRAYHTGNFKAADAVLKAFPAKEAVAFFEELGLLLKVRDEKLFYPYSDQAQSVIDALLREILRCKIKVKCCEKVTSIKTERNGFLVKTEGWQYRADCVILSAGGKAAPSTGSDGNGYALAESLGHTVVPPLPALVPLTVKEAFGKSLEGVRSRAHVTLFIDGQKSADETGELQWTSYGISGIVVFQQSSMAVRSLKAGKKVRLEVNLLPDFSMEELVLKIRRRASYGGSYEELLGGFYHQKILKALLKNANIKPNAPVDEKKAVSIVETSRHIQLAVTGSRSFEQAQVTSGGVPLDEVDEKTMESKKTKNLYLAGEILDVDGPCGGYNLQWAWASGCVAGIHAGKGER